jgi:hypothetical protein
MSRRIAAGNSWSRTGAVAECWVDEVRGRDRGQGAVGREVAIVGGSSFSGDAGRCLTPGTQAAHRDIHDAAAEREV